MHRRVMAGLSKISCLVFLVFVLFACPAEVDVRCNSEDGATRPSNLENEGLIAKVPDDAQGT